MLAVSTERTLTLSLHGLAAGGDAVGRAEDGRVVFVPGGAPGDRVAVRLVEERRDFARGALAEVLTPGPARVAPACPEAAPGRCGGCPLMHIARPAQLAAKEDWVRRAVRRSGAAVLPILEAAPPLGYRVRARLTLRGGRLGFLEARSHRAVDLRACPVLAPALEAALFRAAALLRPALGEGGSLAGLLGRGGAVHLEAAVGQGGDERQVLRLLEALWREGACAGAVVSGRRVGAAAVDLGDEARGPLLGEAGGFAQASAAGHEALPDLVAAAAAPPEGAPRHGRLLELYAGRGNLTRALLGLADEVVAVEGEPAAAAALAARSAAPRRPGEGRLRALSAPVERAARELGAAGDRFPVIVLDPPRAGAREAIASFPALAPQRVVYVSCDPMTLGRDLEILAGQGLRAVSVQPVDLTPHAAHVECVALLVR